MPACPNPHAKMLKIPTIEGFRGGRKSRDGSFFGLILFPGPVYTLPSSVGLNKSHDHEAEPLGGADPVRKADFNLARGSLRGRYVSFHFSSWPGPVYIGARKIPTAVTAAAAAATNGTTSALTIPLAILSHACARTSVAMYICT